MQVEKQTACCIHGLRNDTKAVKTSDYRTTRKFKVVTCLSSELPVGIEEEACISPKTTIDDDSLLCCEMKHSHLAQSN